MALAASILVALTGRVTAEPQRRPPCTLASQPRPTEPCLVADLPAAAATGPGLTPTSPWADHGARPEAFGPGIGGEGAGHPAGRGRQAWSLATLGGVYLGFSTWAYFAWYRGQPDLGEFRWGGDGYFGENTYAGGSDKVGHAWANLVLARASTSLLEWGGWDRGVASAIGAGVAWGLFLIVEVKDGYHYQFSPGDLVANTAGAALSMLFVNVPRADELFDFRVHYYPSAEYLGLLRGEYHGDPQLNSLNIAEDYSGQTYFLALHLGALDLAGRQGALAEALRYVDLGVGFRAQKYKPDSPPGSIRSQEVYLGLTVNLQHALDRATGGARAGALGRTRRIGHAVFEHLGVPYTILPVVHGERSPDR